MTRDSLCPAGGAEGMLRVHVVWFGEMPLEMERIYEALASCDLFVSIGPSGNVYPASGFVAEVRVNGHAHPVELNPKPSEGHSLVGERRYGHVSSEVPASVQRILRKGG